MSGRGVDKAIEALAAAAAPDIEPPDSVVLSEEERPLWVAVTRIRSRGEWNQVDLHHAANLVRCLTDIERIAAELRVEGDVTELPTGALVANPKHAILTTLSQRSMQITRLLHMQPNAATNDRAKLSPQRRAERDARESLREMDDSLPAGVDAMDLLAKPEWRQ